MHIQLSDHFSYSRLIRFTVPSIVMMIFTSVYSVVDGVYKVGGISTKGMAAVALGFVVLAVISVTHLPKKGD